MKVWINRVGGRAGAQIEAFASFLGLTSVRVGPYKTFAYGSNAGGWDGVEVEGDATELATLFDKPVADGEKVDGPGPWDPYWCEARGWKAPKPPTATVPDGKILIVPWSYHVQQYGDCCRYHTYRAGEECSLKDLRDGTLLGEGESVKVHVTDHRGYRGTDILVSNDGGEPKEADHPDAIAERKQFAREQIDRLVASGFGRKTAVAIMKAAGPGRCIAAVEWARYALDTVLSFYDSAADGHPGGAIDALNMLLGGMGGTHGFGKDRTMRALKALGIEPPSVSSSHMLFSVLRGAHVALVAGLPTPPAEDDARAAE